MEKRSCTLWRKPYPRVCEQYFTQLRLGIKEIAERIYKVVDISNLFSPISNKTTGWRILARELITIGADIHAVSTVGRFQDTDEILLTPFISLFRELQWHGWSGSVPRLAQLVATIWLEDLVASGVDLVEYGRKERETWDLSSISKDVPCFFDWGLDSNPEIWHIVNFDFGAAPSD